MSYASTPTVDQLKRALVISEHIQKLETELASLLGGSGKAAEPAKAVIKVKSRGGKRTMSAEAREKIAAAQRARWAKAKGVTVSAKPTPAAKAPKAKGGLTPEGRAKLAAAMKARWAARKKGAPALNAPAKAKAAPASKPAKKARRTISPEARAKMAEAAKRRWAKVKKAA
jgi:hypothetical protein